MSPLVPLFLKRLLGAYFHQDWELDYASVEDAVASYVREHSANEVAATREDIRSLLDTVRDQQALEQIICELGCEYDCLAWRTTPSAFLEKLQEAISRPGEQGDMLRY